MIFDIPELIEEIIQRIDTPQAFLTALRINKEWYEIGKAWIARKKQEFLRLQKYTDKNGLYHQLYTWPNGKPHGEEKIYNDDELLITRQWKNGLLHGIEREYDHDYITRTFPWEYGTLHGKAYRFEKNGAYVEVLFEHGNPKQRDFFDANENLKYRDVYSSKQSLTRWKMNGNGILVKDGVYVKNRKHGAFREMGKDVLYLHGEKQTTWTEAFYLCIAIFAVLFIFGVRSWNSWLYIISLLSILILPLLIAFYRGVKVYFLP